MRDKSPPGPLEYLRRPAIRAWLIGTCIFLYTPLITLMAFSFNNSKRNVVWRGFTLDYYVQVLHDTDLMVAFGNSLTIAAVSTLMSVILGAMTAILLWRFRFPAKPALEGALALPIVVPEICMGVAMLVFFTQVMPWPTEMPWPLNLGAIIISHISFSFSFVAIVIRARLASFNRELEEAAKDLGASEWRIFNDILIPHIRPGLVAGGLLAFTLSLDDFVITFFTSGPDTTTFPVKVYSMARFSPTPEINAVSTVLIIITVALTAIALRLQGTEMASDVAGG
ncbi:ABC transporter permease [Phenylobacterium montanum]|uniref:ABC transporter permease n=1 Tax=Phenylobacterium montanum TaxID=2823693 RepID=A0A975FZV8_9CAUL|nr:ABC transporter permease [Caulobacter sp. S6]QUD88204.1 ABC transporter permease [Caulobacter sp. S6]